MLAVGLPIVSVRYLAFALGIGGLYVASARQLPVSDPEWGVVVDAHDIAGWLPGLEASVREEVLKKVRHVDRSYKVSDEYNPEDASLFVMSSVSVEDRLTDALSRYGPRR